MSTAIIAKSTKIVGYLTSDNVKKIKFKRRNYKPAPVDPFNPMVALMLQSTRDSAQEDGGDPSGQRNLGNPEPASYDGVFTKLEANNSDHTRADTEQYTTTTAVENVQIVEETAVTSGSNIIQDAAMMSQIAAATSIISQPSAVPQTVTTEDVKPGESHVFSLLA